MRSQRTVKKLLRKLEDPETAKATAYTEEELWGMKILLKWVLNLDISNLIKEFDKKVLGRRKK